MNIKIYKGEYSPSGNACAFAETAAQRRSVTLPACVCSFAFRWSCGVRDVVGAVVCFVILVVWHLLACPCLDPSWYLLVSQWYPSPITILLCPLLFATVVFNWLSFQVRFVCLCSINIADFTSSDIRRARSVIESFTYSGWPHWALKFCDNSS